MLTYLLTLFAFLYPLFDPFGSVLANPTHQSFTGYMLEWREKSQVAEDYLRKGQEELKNGQKYQNKDLM